MQVHPLGPLWILCVLADTSGQGHPHWLSGAAFLAFALAIIVQKLPRSPDTRGWIGRRP